MQLPSAVKIILSFIGIVLYLLGMFWLFNLGVPSELRFILFVSSTLPILLVLLIEFIKKNSK